MGEFSAPLQAVDCYRVLLGARFVVGGMVVSSSFLCYKEILLLAFSLHHLTFSIDQEKERGLSYPSPKGRKLLLILLL